MALKTLSSKIIGTGILASALLFVGCTTMPTGTSTELYNVQRAVGPQAIVLDISGSMGSGAGDTIESSLANRAVNQADSAVGYISTGNSLADGVLNTMKSGMFDQARQQTTKLGEAQRQLVPYLRGIPEGTSFDMIAFNANQQHAGGFGAVVSSPATRASAISFVQNLDAYGGTNLSPAINAAMASNPMTIYLITDGQSSDSQSTVMQTVRLAAAQGIRINTIGIGQDQNKSLLQQIASTTGGTFVSRGNGLSIIGL